MPQDVPLRASKRHEFTPDALAGLDVPPRFVLRTARIEEKEFLADLNREEGVQIYGDRLMRDEALTGLKRYWRADAYESLAPQLETFWAARDDFEAARKADPELVWEYDPDLEEAVDELAEKIREAHRPLRRMEARNEKSRDAAMINLVATMVLDWSDVTAPSGDPLPHDLDRGYLTPRCVKELRDALNQTERAKGLPVGTAFLQLYIRAASLLYLDADAEKNSAAPLPSLTPPASSIETTASGTFPESDGSTQILESV